MIIYKRLMNNILKFGSLFFFSMVAFSCAREVEESADSVEKRVLDAYIKVVHKDTLQPTASGLYMIPIKTGTGMPVENLNGVYVRYSTLDLKDNYISTTDANIAKQVGGFRMQHTTDLIFSRQDTILSLRDWKRAYSK